MGIIDHAEQGFIAGGFGEQSKSCQTDLKPLRWRAADESKGRAQSVLLGRWKLIELGQKRDDQLMEPGEPKLHLGFDPNCANYPKVTRRRDGVVEECSLADAGLAP
jgi:hypothetical protein